MNYEDKNNFTTGTMVSFITAENLSSFLVRAKLNPLERTVGFRKCSKKECEVCENVQNPVAFRNGVTSETFKMKYLLTCDAQKSILEKPHIRVS